MKRTIQNRQPTSPLRLNKSNVVGIFHASKKTKENYQLEGIDAIEVRLDLLERLPISEELKELQQRPLIITARHSAEGGNPHLPDAKRLQLFKEALPLAAFIDVELQFWEEYSPSLVSFARKSGTAIIASFHDFLATPPLSELLEKAHLAHQEGVNIFKVATHLNSPADLARLLQLLAAPLPIPLAVMGMGPLGMVSRLALARCGSVLNYGWLESPLVSGQWPVEKFAEILKQC